MSPQELIWPAVVLTLGLAALVLIYRVLHIRLQSLRPGEESVAEQALNLREREVAVRIAEGTVDQATRLKNAELGEKAALAVQREQIAAELKQDHITAQRRVIQARADAQVERAQEYAAAVDEAELAQRDIIGLYERYASIRRSAGKKFGGINEFILSMNRLPR
ncbi:hypothetical protein JNJ66_04615 [Candidatus Saccharibacteria bacterium]|nr:hypothetical protein [Candidatus Saccharibacteria bacterium]